MIVILSHHYDVQKKIQLELDAFIQAHGRLPTFEERDQVPYIIAVQKECMRYKPTTSFGIPHVANNDLVVRDYFFPKGSVLVSNMFGMHMNSDIYSDPEIFKPERFLNNIRTMSSAANGNVNQRDHFNFGWGRRTCPGIYLAEAEMFHIFIRIFANASIVPSLDGDSKEVPIDMEVGLDTGGVNLPHPYQKDTELRLAMPSHVMQKIQIDDDDDNSENMKFIFCMTTNPDETATTSAKATLGDKRQIILAIATIISASIGLRYLFFAKKDMTSKQRFKDIPTPRQQWPIVGHLLSLGQHPGYTVAKWSKELGPIIQLKMGVQTWFVISDPALAQEIFMIHGVATSDRPSHTFLTYYSHGKRGITCSDADKRWKQARAAALSILSPQRVNEFTGVLMYEADALVEQLVSRSQADGQVDPAPYVQNAAMNFILTTCFATRINSVEDQRFKNIREHAIAGLKLAGTEGDLYQFFPYISALEVLLGKKRMYRDFIANSSDPLFTRLIKDALSSDKDSMVKTLMALKDEHDLDDEDVLVVMCDLFGGGSDTSSVSISWMIVILSHHPDVQKKIQAELDAFTQIHGRIPTFEERDQVPYLIAVQKECMRYKPLITFHLPHVASRDLVVRDYFIPKGTVLETNMIGLHMDPDIYPDPETFKPERFLNNTRTMSSSANGNVNQRDLFIFGWGRRICPGIYLAEVEIFHIFVRIFANASIAAPLDGGGKEVPIDMDAILDTGVSYLPQPYQVRFIPRSVSPLK
ncbi:cytochrome P450 [Halteromyces radiatus]|uniref:cytochrome P450 n=1 Tax=Halteromyces radiatus TaxID=101107 RepID=UPI00222057F6|nr:cytochrome P450 [Halteromyces radiatus]KAI8075986.1 cytochrome P450 [Halteromyces radiatus]